MHQETPTYRADGLTMRSQLFFEPAAAPRAGAPVFPEAFGLGAHAISRAERLAALGYVALACDLQQAIGMLEPLFADPARIAATGFCFGGTMALELARSGAELKAVVGFHSGLATRAPRTEAGTIKARILVCIGADDPMIPLGQRAGFEAEMREAGVDWQMHA